MREGSFLLKAAGKSMGFSSIAKIRGLIGCRIHGITLFCGL
jgi:hypothetical protein